MLPRHESAPVFCLDRRSDSQRRRAPDGAEGLSALIATPRTPASLAAALDSGFYVPSDGPGVFLHREEYRIEGGITKTRWGVIAGLDPVLGEVHPVVSPPREPLEPFVEQVRLAGVDPGGTTLLYRDEEHMIEKLVDARGTSDPLLALEEPDGSQHRVWRLSDDEAEVVLQLLAHCPSTLVGDLSVYRAMARLAGEFGGPQRQGTIVHCFNQRDFGVTLASCAHLFDLPSEFEVNAFVAGLYSDFEIVEFNVGAPEVEPRAWNNFYDMIRTEGITQKVVGLSVRGIENAYMVRVPEGQRPPGVDDSVPESAIEYDAEWVYRSIVDRYFPPDSQRASDILVEPRRVPECFMHPCDHRRVSVVLNPPPKRHIPDLAGLKWQLPFGTIQVRPVVPRGLFLRSFASQPSV